MKTLWAIGVLIIVFGCNSSTSSDEALKATVDSLKLALQSPGDGYKKIEFDMFSTWVEFQKLSKESGEFKLSDTGNNLYKRDTNIIVVGNMLVGRCDSLPVTWEGYRYFKKTLTYDEAFKEPSSPILATRKNPTNNTDLNYYLSNDSALHGSDIISTGNFEYLTGKGFILTSDAGVGKIVIYYKPK